MTDISGVWSAGVTAPHHEIANEHGEHEDRELRDEVVALLRGRCFLRERGACERANRENGDCECGKHGA